MNHHRFHLFEKILVELVCAAALAGGYFILWPLVRPSDPLGAASFTAPGGFSAGCVLACGVLILTVLCTAILASARPESGLLAVMVGIAGVSLRSPQIRSLIWERGGNGLLFAGLGLELLALAAVMFAAALLASLLRRLISRALPRWAWSAESVIDPSKFPVVHSALGVLPLSLSEIGLGRGADKTDRQRGLCCLYCGVLSVAFAIIAMLVLIRSAQRGQILFGLFAGFALAVLAAHQKFPAAYSIVAWAAPFVVGIIFYAFAAVGGVGTSPQSWSAVPLYARALPVDWFSAGAGGALAGYWISARMHEAHIFEKAERE